MEYVIELENVKKKYKLYKNQKERLLDLILPKNYGEEFYALKGVDFKAKAGDTIGFVGINGSGKSTLLNIVAGISPETSGSVIVRGQTALISVATGFKESLTGRENLEMKCLMLGFSKQEIDAMEEEIIEFSELNRFIDQPMKNYSSGMKSRLGFAISVMVDPDILIIDEALSVGDATFTKKCLDKIKEFQQKGKTIIFVSHSNYQIKQFCNKVVWLEYGKVKAYGPTVETMKAYEEFIAEFNKLSKEEKKAYQEKHKFNN